MNVEVKLVSPSVRFYSARQGDNLMFVRGNVETYARANWRMASVTLSALMPRKNYPAEMNVRVVVEGLNLIRQTHVGEEYFKDAVVKAIGDLSFEPMNRNIDTKRLLALADELYIDPGQIREAVKRLIAGPTQQVKRVEDLRLSPEGLHTFSALVIMRTQVDLTDFTIEKATFPRHEKPELRVILGKMFAGKPLVVVGGAIGDDDHTVGIDAILDMKGVDGEKGLEDLNEVEKPPVAEIVNLGGGIAPERFVSEAVHTGAHLILVSRVLTEKDEWVELVRKLNSLIREAKNMGEMHPDVMLMVGGPQLDALKAVKGQADFDQMDPVIFGEGTYADEVASYYVFRRTEAIMAAKHLVQEGVVPNNSAGTAEIKEGA